MENSILSEKNIEKIIKESIHIESLLQRHNLTIIDEINNNYTELRHIISLQSQIIFSQRYQ